MESMADRFFSAACWALFASVCCWGFAREREAALLLAGVSIGSAIVSLVAQRMGRP